MTDMHRSDTTSTEEPPVAPEEEAESKGRLETPAEVRRNRILGWRTMLVLVALVGVGVILRAWQLPPFQGADQRTDNAYVRGQITIISPQVSGYVREVLVQDYQAVKAGQLLAKIDDRIYDQRVEQAKADLRAAEVALANSAQSRSSAVSQVANQQAAINSARAEVTRARADDARIESLVRQGWATRAQLDSVRAALQAAEARLAQAQAQESAASTGVTSVEVNRGALQAAVDNARAKLHLAEIDLENTRILAPRAGRLGEVAVRQGQQVAVGTQMMTLVPDNLWVVANMKESQMKNVAVGQPATFSVDALGGARLHGHVERISPATGSEFSIIRTDTSSGNFIKIPQRVSVRIAIDPGQALAARLRPGLSVEVEVDTSAER